MAEQKIALVVGLGLIGGSVAMALRGFEDYRVIGADRDAHTLDFAAEGPGKQRGSKSSTPVMVLLRKAMLFIWG